MIIFVRYKKKIIFPTCLPIRQTVESERENKQYFNLGLIWMIFPINQSVRVNEVPVYKLNFDINISKLTCTMYNEYLVQVSLQYFKWFTVSWDDKVCASWVSLPVIQRWQFFFTSCRIIWKIKYMESITSRWTTSNVRKKRHVHIYIRNCTTQHL
jgi:hypothetical protein